jgi:chromosome segregation ATPase
MVDLAYQTLQNTIERLRDERDDARQQLAHAQLQIDVLQRENILLKEKIHALELEIEKLKVNMEEV